MRTLRPASPWRDDVVYATVEDSTDEDWWLFDNALIFSLGWFSAFLLIKLAQALS